MSTPQDQRQNRNACLEALAAAQESLVGASLSLPTWAELARGARAPDRGTDAEPDPGEWQHGWQYYTTAHLQSQRQTQLAAVAMPADVARYRSCKGVHNSRWLSVVPYNEALELCNPAFQWLLRRRLGLPILADHEHCEGRTCQSQLDRFGHHRSACTRTGRIHGRHAAAIAPWRQVLHEAGYQVRSERLLRDTHVATDVADQRRMDLVAAPGARGLGARRGVALFLDVTIVSVLTAAGAPRPSTTNADGAALRQIIAAKRRRYADVRATSGASFLVLGCEAYGRWSEDAISLMRELVALKAREAPALLRASARHAWSSRWWALVSVGVHRAIAEALIRHGGPDLQPAAPVAEPPPAHGRPKPAIRLSLAPAWARWCSRSPPPPAACRRSRLRLSPGGRASR